MASKAQRVKCTVCGKRYSSRYIKAHMSRRHEPMDEVVNELESLAELSMKPAARVLSDSARDLFLSVRPVVVDGQVSGYFVTADAVVDLGKHLLQ